MTRSLLLIFSTWLLVLDAALGQGVRGQQAPGSSPIEGAGSGSPAFLAAPKVDDPRLSVRTSMGDFEIRLFRSRAPATANHFLQIATGTRPFIDVATGKQVSRPFYNGLIFHRVIKDFLIQGGCPFGTGRGGSGDTIRDEWNSTMNFDRPGLIAMAPLRNSNFSPVPNSSSSQFFITLSERPELNDDKYTIFGEVVKGMSVVRRIGAVATGPTDRPIKKITILSIEAL